ncbi:MAG: hypothetical protein IJZ94_05645 [Clostridia bacterium]|nr:hypothetical protein [Clostridia bacterium]
MKDKKKLKRNIIIISVIVLYITVSVVLSVFLWKKNGGLTPGVTVYGLSDAYITDNLTVTEYGDGGPVLITNGINNSVYYTAPELDMGYISEYFGGQSDADYYSPSMVIGEGEASGNSTIVRVYNEQQVCTAQFPAFPSTVSGGVAVAACQTQIDGESVTLIATSAYGVYCDDARCVRVYDTSGMLYMKIVPEFYEDAPFAIATGHFVAGDTNEYLLIASSVITDGKIDAALYSLSDGSVKGEYVYKLGDENNGKKIYFSVRNKTDGNDSIIAFAKGEEDKAYQYLGIDEDDIDVETIDTTELYAVFEGVPSGDLQKVDIVLPYGAAGVYSSVNSDEKYIVTAENELFDNYVSYVFVYGHGDREGTLLYVDYEENRFYWNADKSVLELGTFSDEKDSYIRYADEFTVDVSENPYETIKNIEKTAEFAYWKVKLSEYGLSPARSLYDALVKEYRENPSSVVSIELFSISDILTDISLDDKDEDARKAFADYLMNLYISVENINEKFGTAFTCEEDINIPLKPEPEVEDDLSEEYTSEEDVSEESISDEDISKEELYYDEWFKFCRYRVSMRITSLYSQAVSSGLSPEILTCNAELADYPPNVNFAEDYNIENTAYINEYSLVSESGLYNIGASLGISRMGIWYENPRRASAFAFSAGFKNITLSSYSGETDSYSQSFYQMLYLFRNGCKYIGIKSSENDYGAAELNGLDLLKSRNESRTGYAHGTRGSLAIDYNGKKYNLVTIGYNTNGLLKSINSDGTREGSVYVVPFHSRVETIGADIHNNPRRGLNFAEFKDLAGGSQIEVRFTASCQNSKNSYVKINVYHEGFLLEDACVSYKLDSVDRYYRYVFINNLEIGDIKVEIEFVCEDYSDYNLNDIDMIFQRENTVYPLAGDFNGSTAYGSVTVDVLNREAVYEE